MDPKTGELAAPQPRQVFDTPHTPEKSEVKKTPQFLAREEMAKRVQAERSVEDKSFTPDILDDDGNITPSVPVEQSAEPEIQETEQVEPETVDPVIEEPPTEPEEERELVVNGQRVKVPLSKILDAGTRALQKESAADQRLAAAAELERQLSERLQRLQPSQDVEPRHEAPQTVDQPSQEDAALAHDIQFGTEEQAAKALSKLRSSGRGLDERQLQKFVQTSIPDQIAFFTANERVRSDYKEIFADKDFEQMFMFQESKARQTGDRRPYAELYKDIAEGMVTKFNLRKAEVSEPKATTMQDRVVRKANAPRPVQSAAGPGSKGEQAPKRALTVSEYVTQQRQKRGLQPMSKGI